MLKILDGPGAPEGVEVNEIPDDRKSSGSCILTLYTILMCMHGYPWC